MLLQPTASARQDVPYKRRTSVHQPGVDLDQDSPGIQRTPRILGSRHPSRGHDWQPPPSEMRNRLHAGKRPLAQRPAAHPAGFCLRWRPESVTRQGGVRSDDAAYPRIHHRADSILQLRLGEVGGDLHLVLTGRRDHGAYPRKLG